MKDYKQLTFWQDSHVLALDIYKLSNTFPKNETYGITSQIRRASLSVPTNIAEGCGRESVKEFRRYLVIASGSITEVEYLLLFSFDSGLISKEIHTRYTDRAISIKKKITAYKNKLK